MLKASEVPVRATVVALFLVSVGAVEPVVGQDFDNTDATPAWSAATPPPMTALGQVVGTNATNPFLRSFSFWVGGTGAPITYEAFLVELYPPVALQTTLGSGSGFPVLGGGPGPVTPSPSEEVWSSGPITSALASVSDPSFLASYQRLDFGVGLMINPNLQYAAFLRATEPGISIAGRSRPGDGIADRGDAWGGAEFELDLAPGLPAPPFRLFAGFALDESEVAFAADFCPSAASCETVSVREPPTAWMLLVGLVALCGVARRQVEV